MILIDDGNTELGRALRASLPGGVTVQAEPGAYVLSAYPSVVVDVPAYSETVPTYDADGGLTGMETRTVAAHEEVLRMPVSWNAVAQYNEYAAARAAQEPAE